MEIGRLSVAGITGKAVDEIGVRAAQLGKVVDDQEQGRLRVFLVRLFMTGRRPAVQFAVEISQQAFQPFLFWQPDDRAGMGHGLEGAQTTAAELQDVELGFLGSVGGSQREQDGGKRHGLTAARHAQDPQVPITLFEVHLQAFMPALLGQVVVNRAASREVIQEMAGDEELDARIRVGRLAPPGMPPDFDNMAPQLARLGGEIDLLDATG